MSEIKYLFESELDSITCPLVNQKCLGSSCMAWKNKVGEKPRGVVNILRKEARLTDDRDIEVVRCFIADIPENYKLSVNKRCVVGDGFVDVICDSASEIEYARRAGNYRGVISMPDIMATAFDCFDTVGKQQGYCSYFYGVKS